MSGGHAAGAAGVAGADATTFVGGVVGSVVGTGGGSVGIATVTAGGGGGGGGGGGTLRGGSIAAAEHARPKTDVATTKGNQEALMRIAAFPP